MKNLFHLIILKIKFVKRVTEERAQIAEEKVHDLEGQLKDAMQRIRQLEAANNNNNTNK